MDIPVDAIVRVYLRDPLWIDRIVEPGEDRANKLAALRCCHVGRDAAQVIGQNWCGADIDHVVLVRAFEEHRTHFRFLPHQPVGTRRIADGGAQSLTRASHPGAAVQGLGASMNQPIVAAIPGMKAMLPSIEKDRAIHRVLVVWPRGSTIAPFPKVGRQQDGLRLLLHGAKSELSLVSGLDQVFIYHQEEIRLGPVLVGKRRILQVIDRLQLTQLDSLHYATWADSRLSSGVVWNHLLPLSSWYYPMNTLGGATENNHPMR